MVLTSHYGDYTTMEDLLYYPQTCPVWVFQQERPESIRTRHRFGITFIARRQPADRLYSTLVDLAHHGNLARPLDDVILIDAQLVDPEVAGRYALRLLCPLQKAEKVLPDLKGATIDEDDKSRGFSTPYIRQGDVLRRRIEVEVLDVVVHGGWLSRVITGVKLQETYLSLFRSQRHMCEDGRCIILNQAREGCERDVDGHRGGGCKESFDMRFEREKIGRTRLAFYVRTCLQQYHRQQSTAEVEGASHVIWRCALEPHFCRRVP